MPLESGARLGPYEVVNAVGAGGMGEVYRARDTRLDRSVAIKVLSSSLSASAELKLRFEREAKAISSLNHPNICALYDVGTENGTDYLVMEFIEGETLSDVLKRGPISIDRAVEIAIQVVDALERAHRQGIIHRDLKPGNIMLTKRGAKLMDFGLAKPAAAGASAVAASGVSPLFSAAVTRSSPVSPLTSAGAVVGTVQYMSPEQIEGRDSDPRSDIFAFGLVVYEMIGGRRAFDGKTQASVVASILALDPPPLTTIKPETPPALESIVRTCLAKDPEERFQTAHDLKLQLQLLSQLKTGARASASASAPKLMWIAIAALLLTTIGAGWYAWNLASAPKPVVRGIILPPEKGSFTLFTSPQISPDGKHVVYSANVAGVSQLWVQSLDSETPRPLGSTEGGTFPFWSPDNASVAFFSGSRLKRVDIGGGPVQTLCDVTDGRGGSWGPDGVIIFGSRVGTIMKVSAGGGTPTPVTTFDKSKSHGTHRWPHFLPGGKQFIFMTGITGNDSPRNELYIGNIADGSSRKILAASSSAVYADGYLLYRRDNTLMAHPFDAAKGEFTGSAVPLVEQIKFDPGFSFASASASSNGVLVYQHGLGASGAQQLTLFDLNGKAVGTVGDPATAYGFRVSPDGSRAAVTVVDGGGNVDLWIYDIKRGGVKSRFTFAPERDYEAVWTADGKQVIYSSERDNGRGQLYIKAADGSGSEQRLLTSPDYDIPDSVSQDGKTLVFTSRIQNNANLMWMELGTRKVSPYLASNFNEYMGNISPDGKWLTYGSDESGRFEVYISTFPQAGGKWQISTSGGRESQWSPDGKNLYYLDNNNDLIAVSVNTSGNSIQASLPRKVFSTYPVPGRKVYHVGRDGRILINGFDYNRTSVSPLSFTLNWTQTLRR